MTFGRLIWYTTPLDKLKFRTLWCPPRFITPIFVTFDLLSFLVQLLGVSAVGEAFQDKTLTPDERLRQTKGGLRILRLGLLLQLACFGIFAIIGFRFLVVSKRWNVLSATAEGVQEHGWRRVNLAVNGAATLIMVSYLSQSRAFDGKGTMG
jgi:RTA1 like protein